MPCFCTVPSYLFVQFFLFLVVLYSAPQSGTSRRYSIIFAIDVLMASKKATQPSAGQQNLTIYFYTYVISSHYLRRKLNQVYNCFDSVCDAVESTYYRIIRVGDAAYRGIPNYKRLSCSFNILSVLVTILDNWLNVYGIAVIGR